MRSVRGYRVIGTNAHSEGNIALSNIVNQEELDRLFLPGREAIDLAIDILDILQTIGRAVGSGKGIDALRLV